MLNVKLLAFRDAPAAVYGQGAARLEKLMPDGRYTLVDRDPDLLFFLSGGSERIALDHVSAGRFYLLIGSRHDNSYASATEVKARMNDLNIPSMLLDEEEDATKAWLAHFATALQALKQLKGRRLGLIGQVSDWLVSSSVSPDVLKSKLGISLIPVSWEEVGDYADFPPSEPFLRFYPASQNADLTATAQVSEMLSATIRNRGLDAISVECFPMVQQKGVTACLPLARFNHEGFPAGCEGDLTAIAGMMLCRELTGVVPWIANLNRVAPEGCLFSHCTIAPGLVSDYSVTTHFETGKGTAIAGKFREDRVTVFRFDSTLGRAFIATADITGRPSSATACRTQVEVALNGREQQLLRDFPLGNHHLILPGDSKELIIAVCLLLGIEVQK